MPPIWRKTANMFGVWVWGVSKHAHVHVCVLHACAGVCACRGQRSTLSVIIQEMPILFFQTESGTWGSWIRLGWLMWE